MNEKQDELQKYKDKYEQLKSDVIIKLKLLDENQVCSNERFRCLFSKFKMFFFSVQTKVMKKQLLLFHNAIAAYFSGNKEGLDATMKQFNLKITTNGASNQGNTSFLEKFNY